MTRFRHRAPGRRDVPAARVDGNPVSLEDLRGKAVWMNFFASWCPPCQASHRSCARSRKNKTRASKWSRRSRGTTPTMSATTGIVTILTSRRIRWFRARVQPVPRPCAADAVLRGPGRGDPLRRQGPTQPHGRVPAGPAILPKLSSSPQRCACAACRRHHDSAVMCLLKVVVQSKWLAPPTGATRWALRWAAEEGDFRRDLSLWFHRRSRPFGRCSTQTDVT